MLNCVKTDSDTNCVDTSNDIVDVDYGNINEPTTLVACSKKLKNKDDIKSHIDSKYIVLGVPQNPIQRISVFPCIKILVHTFKNGYNKDLRFWFLGVRYSGN